MQRIGITDDGHFFQMDNKPFFWLADTAWELFHRLDREEADDYLKARAAQGYTVIQAVALSEFDGLTVPNTYGRIPLETNENGYFDPTLPDLDGEYSYWSHMDWIIKRAGQYGLIVALLPTWGDKFNIKWGKGPVIFTPDNARVYGAWIGARYRDYDNILWMLGGDRPLETDEHHTIIRAMAEGIKEGGADHLMTYHPYGGHSSSDFVQQEQWLDFNAFQSGHGSGWHLSWKMTEHDWALNPIRPVINAEPRYEDHPAYFRADSRYIWSAADARMHIWWDCLSGAAGHTYGNHCIWSMTKEATTYFPYTWREALWHPGARQMAIAKNTLMRYMPTREPMQTLLREMGDNASHFTAAYSAPYALCYSPLGLPFRLDLSKLGGEAVRATFICPRSGDETIIGIFPKEDWTFVPPVQGTDWVLLLEEFGG